MSSDEIAAALVRAGIVEVDASTRRRAEYSSDASLYRVPPAVVAFPREVAEVVAVLDTCRELGVPLTARGSGTSIAGNAIGPGVVIDLRRHLDRIVEIDPESRTAMIEPGVVLDDLQRAAAVHGLRFGPDPSTHDRCTIGGMIGNNACGSRALGFGRTVDHVLGLDVVTGGGERLHTDAPHRLVDDSRRLAEAHARVIRDELDRFPRQVSGYGLHHLLAAGGPDLGRALVGSEGTLGVVLGARLSLVDIPAASVLLVLGYADMVAAAEAVPGLLDAARKIDARCVAMEGLDARIVDVVRSRRGEQAVPDLPAGAGWLFVEVVGDDDGEARAAADRLAENAAALDRRAVTDAGEARALWRIREDGAGLAAYAGDEPAHAGWEDAAVPPGRLGAYLREFEALVADHGLAGVPYGHFGDGCVHVRLTFPLGRPGGREVFRDFVADAARLVAEHGGSLSGEHGDGRARSALLGAMYSPAALEAFAAFKGLLDPDDVCNPGVLVRPRPVDADLRAELAQPVTAGLGFAYLDDGGDVSRAVHRCTGIGRCRIVPIGDEQVMCPSFAATRDEKDSTRGRARVLQEMIVGELVTDGWRSPEVHDALDLCLACKGCASDCPTGVDMAAYKAEALHQTYKGRLRPRSHYALGWLPRWARLASGAPRLASWLVASRALAPVVRRLAGIDRRRGLPAFAPRTFTAWFSSHEPPRDAGSRPTVVLWPDTFTDRFAPAIGVAAVKVLEDAGYTVRLPSARVCCALTWTSTGQLDAARRILGRTIDTLAADVADGSPIVGLEPSCTAVLRKDARELLGDVEAVRTVAAATRTLAEVLAARRPDWTPPRLDGITVVAQPHCHQHAVMGWSTDQALLAACGAEVRRVGGCCGLAGDFGVTDGHYEVSVAVAEQQLLPAVRDAPGAIVLADGFSCRTQLADLERRESRHLAELLAAAIAERDTVDA